MPDIDPLSPDAPIVALLSLRNDPAPFLAMSPEEQLAFVRKLRTIVAQPVTLQAELRREAAPKTGKAAKLKSILDSI